MIIIKGELSTPYVKLDKENCTLTIIGKSYPENPSTFYTPLVEEIETCKKDLEKSKITIKIALEIMNSVSTKYLFQVIKEIYESAKETVIDWYYEEEDEDMEEAGENFKSSFPKSNFNLIEVGDLRKI